MADVAACFAAICDLPVVRARLRNLSDTDLTNAALERLAVITFLHDCGKLHPGFQAKGWQKPTACLPLRGHCAEGAAIVAGQAGREIALAVNTNDIIRWGSGATIQDLLLASFSHHGRPISMHGASGAGGGWTPYVGGNIHYDPLIEARVVGECAKAWFTLAFSEASGALPDGEPFAHLFAGLVALADWLGSDRRFFPFKERLDNAYWDEAKARGRKAVTSIGLDVARWLEHLPRPPDFAQVTGLAAPNLQQSMVEQSSLDEQLLILEAETGSGKTEAALWHFARLFQAGRVSGLYFALPTRAAARQLHHRVTAMTASLFGPNGPEPVLAVPGYLQAGASTGQALPHWQVLWDDQDQADWDVLAGRWAAESARRSLAATIAVGTVDQALLAGLQVKHAHLRRAALSRSLLVVDEVHASDSYMAQVLGQLLSGHLEAGGYAFLMSATLGSWARAKWLGLRVPPSFDQASADPFPALWGRAGFQCPPQLGPQTDKAVKMIVEPTMDGAHAAKIAMAAARQGARVLIIRNTIKEALATCQAVLDEDGQSLLLNVGGVPTLHHSRFAPEDRNLLDQAVEQALKPRIRSEHGVIVIGTQTLEQSLDIDADLLITDLCPVDVLLQRIGRLHRHADPARPAAFSRPCCHLLCPDQGLESLLRPAFINGLGAWSEGGGKGWSGIYWNVSILELTRRLALAHPHWLLPSMNRPLVEGATHPEKIDAFHAEMGPLWARYHGKIMGFEAAAAGLGGNVALETDRPFADQAFPGDEERIRTRLGEEGPRLTFEQPVKGPFGHVITGVPLPPHWARGLDLTLPVTVEVCDGQDLVIAISGRTFKYGRFGLTTGGNE
jgi:CRISPR-associated endonuclease/helicase Cas3